MPTSPDTIPFGTPPITASADTIPFGAPPIASIPPKGTGLSSILAGAGNVLSNIEQPFVSVAATPVQLLAKGLGQPDPFANKAFPGPNGQGVPVSPAPTTPSTFLQKAGQAAQIGTLAITPAYSGLKALTAIGAGSGAAQSVANANSPQQVLKDTIYGGLFGFGLGLGGKFLSYMGRTEQGRTGVEGAVQDAISNTDPVLLGKYINASKTHGETMAALAQPTAIGLAENTFNERASLLTDKVIPQAGEAVGVAKRAGGTLPITVIDNVQGPIVGKEAVNSISDSINNAMQQMTGHQFASYNVGETSGLKISNYPLGPSTAGLGLTEGGGISALPGRSIDLSTSESKQLENLATQLQKLRDNPNVQTASDVLVNIDNAIGKWTNPQFGQGNSPVEGLLKYARGTINRSIAPASPEIAKANATYSSLMDLKSSIAQQAGNEGQSSALMMRRVLSGDKSNSVVPVLNQLDAVTAPFRKGDSTSLVQHSILSNWSTTMFGDESTKQLLAKALSEGNKMSGEGASIFGYPKQFMNYLIRGALTSLSPDPAKFAMSVSQGNPYSLNPLVRFLDREVMKKTNIPIIDQFSKQLQDWGVNAHGAEPAAKTLFKIYLMQQLTRSNQYTAPTGGPPTLSAPNTLSY